jgi:hypothetical protein
MNHSRARVTDSSSAAGSGRDSVHAGLLDAAGAVPRDGELGASTVTPGDALSESD